MPTNKYSEALWLEIIEHRKQHGTKLKDLQKLFGPSCGQIGKVLKAGHPPARRETLTAGRFKPISEEERIARFWAKVEKSDGCWLFTGAGNKDGYGIVGNSDRRSTMGAHVYSFRLHYGPTYGLYVCHRCDTKRCVRPDHLFAGSALTNSRDLVSKGLQVRGERQGFCKYSDAFIQEVLAYREKTGANNCELSRIFGPHHTTIAKIVTGKLRCYLNPSLTQQPNCSAVATE